MSALKQGKSATYLKIFDLVDVQEEYDEKKVLEELKDPSMKKQFPVLKNYLYRMLLKSLRNFQSEKSINFRIREYLMNSELLSSRDLIPQAIKQLEKAQKLALKFEALQFMPEIGSMQSMFSVKVVQQKLTEVDTQLDGIYSETQKFMNQFLELQAYRHVSLKLLVLNRRENSIRDEKSRKSFQDLIDHPILKSAPPLHSPKAMVFYHQSFLIFHAANNDFAEAYKSVLAIVGNMEAHPYLIVEKPDNYLHSLRNLLAISSVSQPRETTRAHLDSLNSLPKRFPKARFDKANLHMLPLIAYNQELSMLLETNQLDEASKLLPGVAQLLKENNYKLTFNEGFLVAGAFLNVAHLHLYKGQYPEALGFLKRILNADGLSGEYAIHMDARILIIIIYSELEEESLLDHSVLSLYRALKKKEKLHRFEKAFFDFVRKLSKAVPGDSRVSCFTKLREDLLQIQADENEKLGLHPFDLLAWLDKRIAGQS